MVVVIINLKKCNENNKMWINFLPLYLIRTLFFQTNFKNSLILIENKEYALRNIINNYLQLSIMTLGVMELCKTQSNVQ